MTSIYGLKDYAISQRTDRLKKHLYGAAISTASNMLHVTDNGHGFNN